MGLFPKSKREPEVDVYGQQLAALADRVAVLEEQLEALRQAIAASFHMSV